VAEGKITDAKIFGDFFGLGDIADVEQALIGTRYAKEDLAQVIANIDVKKYFGNITPEDFLSLIY
jgi:lipoate-protein ligase A